VEWVLVPIHGDRPLKRAIQRRIEIQLAKKTLSGGFAPKLVTVLAG
jgi:ATP-dependent Clp protease ATP-binding subunit ClpA